MRTLLAAAALCLIATSADAVTSPRPWTNPGANPCRDLCPEAWSVEQMRNAGVLPGDLLAALRQAPTADYPVQDGDLIVAMTYAKDGRPYLDTEHRLASFDVPYHAHGHSIVWRGRMWRLVRVTACGNWALLVSGPFMAESITPGPGLLTPAAISSSVGPAVGGGGGFGAVGGGGGGGGGRLVPVPIFLPGAPPAPEVPTLPKTPIIPPISLPGTLGLLLTALLSLPLLGWREP